MEIVILDKDYTPLTVIDYASSIIWNERYCGNGDFELYIPANPQAMTYLKANNLVKRLDRPESLMVIKSLEISTDYDNGDFITVKGVGIADYLARRVVWGQVNMYDTPPMLVRRLLNLNVISPSDDNRKIDGIELGEYPEMSDKISIQYTGTNLLELIIEILKSYNLGFKMRYDSGILYFDIYQGEDRSFFQVDNPRITFSDKYNNIITSKYLADVSPFKNAALILGEGDGADRKGTGIGEASGLSRYELYVDAKSVSSKTDDGELTEDEYVELLAQSGVTKLAECNVSESLDAEVDARGEFVLNEDFFLGDIVNFETKYGILQIARVSEIIECWDENGYTCEPKFECVEV